MQNIKKDERIHVGNTQKQESISFTNIESVVNHRCEARFKVLSCLILHGKFIIIH